MTVEDIIRGESRNVEFKASLPEKSEKYTKTIVAFANTQGGTLIIGIDDQSRQVIGIDEEDRSAFEMMDSIANAVDDSCFPQIVPNIELQTVNGKTIIVVTVLPSANRPYYLKSKGKENGTYIRVAGTTRPASPEKIRELEMEGARISWDELTCVGYEVKADAIDRLCRDITEYREKAGLPKRRVTEMQLVNWRLLKTAEDSYEASNAFVLLTSDYFPFSKTQCAVFKGTGRSVFLDKREFTGPIYVQIEEAMNFVLRNIRLGATIHGLLRRESYELPVDAIREMIINAHCHRNLTDEACVQVAVYDDRLEVTSPGGLYNGLTYEDMLNGHSRIRNRAIANVFNQMGLVESWGTGIQRVTEAAEDYHLPKPEFAASDSMFRVNLFRSYSGAAEEKTGPASKMPQHRKNDDDTSEEHRNKESEASEKHRNKNTELNETQLKIVELLSENPALTGDELAHHIQISRRNIESNISSLKKMGILVRHGANKGGHWEVVL